MRAAENVHRSGRITNQRSYCVFNYVNIVGTFFVFVCLVISLGPTSNRAETIALSINYSLLVPIYLAWVVKFFAELENNMGAVERIVDYFSL